MKILNFDKLQSPKSNIFKDMTGSLRLNYENINLQKDIRNSRCLIIDSSLFHSNQMKTRKIDHSVKYDLGFSAVLGNQRLNSVTVRI